MVCFYRNKKINAVFKVDVKNFRPKIAAEPRKLGVKSPKIVRPVLRPPRRRLVDDKRTLDAPAAHAVSPTEDQLADMVEDQSNNLVIGHNRETDYHDKMDTNPAEPSGARRSSMPGHPGDRMIHRQVRRRASDAQARQVRLSCGFLVYVALLVPNIL